MVITVFKLIRNRRLPRVGAVWLLAAVSGFSMGEKSIVSASESAVAIDPVPSMMASAPGAQLTRGPYLQMLTATRVVVRWRTDQVVAGVVRFGTQASALNQTKNGATLTTHHEVALEGLQANTRYYYSVETASGVLAQGAAYFFTTAPAEEEGRAIRVWVVGDSGRTTSGARAVRDAYLTFNQGRSTDLMLMLGDNAYENGTDAEMQSAIYSQYPTVLRNTPVWPALGNHDAASSTSVSSTLPHFVNWTLPANGEAGGRASGTEKYYAFNFGPVHFICLDSYASDRSSAGAMMNWLRADLIQNTREWVVAYWHHAPYSKGNGDSDSTPESAAMRSVANRILEDAGVDLVLGGHSHAYERSYLIDGHYGGSTTFVSSMRKDGGNGRDEGDGPYYKLAGSAPHQGTVYAVVGCSSSADGGALNHPAMAVSLNVLGSMVLDWRENAGRMKATFLDSAGVVRDWFVIQKTYPPVVVITVQPQSQAVEPGQWAMLRVGAISAHPIRYQWRREGWPMPGATNDILVFPGVQEEHQGLYDVVVEDGAGTVISESARVSLRIAPLVVQAPVDVTVVQGGSVTLSVQSLGTLPMGYRWRRSANTLVNRVLDSHQDFYTIHNAQDIDQGNYTVVLTNEVFHLPGVLSPAARLTVLPDTDADGMPDEWEAAHELDPMDGADAHLDLDGDGMTHGDEYRCGTDPRDAESYLRIEEIDREGKEETVNIRFVAVSNRTYSVRYKQSITDMIWIKLADVVASATNRQVVVTDRALGGRRYYQLVTPREP